MPLIKITRQGLCSIAVSTALLWGCIFVERLTVARAREDAYRALQEIRELQIKKQVIPAAVPGFRPQPARPAVG